MGYAKPCPCSQVSTTLSVYAALVQANSYSIRTQCRGQRPRPTWSLPTRSLRTVSVRQGRVIECWGVAKR
jgi:hypothetical protein